MRHAAASAAATADALLAWLGTQPRSGAAAAPVESNEHPEGAASAQDSAGGDGVADALTLDVSATAFAAGESTSAACPVKCANADCRAAPMWLAHIDRLHHRLAIIGMAEPLAAFRRAAAGAGVIPWQLDLDRMEEDVFHLMACARQSELDTRVLIVAEQMAAPPSTQPRTLSVAGARMLAGQVREAVGRRHERAVARIGASQACPFDLHALVPVPDEMLRLGPDYPVALAWLWEHWGTTQPLRHVAEDVVASQEARRGSVLAAQQHAIHVTFWSADWTPWRPPGSTGRTLATAARRRTPDVRRIVTDIMQKAGDSAELVAEIFAWEDPPRAASMELAPVLSVDGFEGPLDWLLEMAQTGKIDLARLSIMALIEAFATALEAALARQIGGRAAELGRWGTSLVMAATLAFVRSWLLLPSDSPEGKAATDETEALRYRLVSRAQVRAATDWRARRP